MALDSGNIRLASTGHIYVAPFGTALPNTATANLNASFKELGYASEDGVTITPSVNTSGVQAWQAAVDVMTILTGVGLDLKFSMIEVTQTTTAEFFFGATWVNTFGHGKLDFNSNPLLAVRSLIVDWTEDDGFLNRFVIDRGVITDHGDMVLKRIDNVALNVTFHVLDNNGTLGRFYSTNPDLIPAT